ncbi:MAG: extracellular solute-binding protein [Hungatella sp.]|jgi:putative aldouronate transport system substrate-binding protein|nr:extracellular solute-binding protein [Hungatella sp.]
MKKRMIAVLTLLALAASLTACGNRKADTAPEGSQSAAASGGTSEELDGVRFKETRKITVEVFDRANDGGSKPENNFYTDYIKEGMLRDHNVEVEFVPVPRWTEVEQMNNLLASGDAPDVCVTYNYPTIQVYAEMGGIYNLKDIVDDYKDLLPNLWGHLGETCIYWDKLPNGDLWALEARLAVLARTNTFIRKDWLDKLGLKEPTTMEEFEAALEAFKDNAELLLGGEANKMIPMSISYDVGWRGDLLFASMTPEAITDKDRYVYGFDDRRFLYPGVKEGVKVLNDWYNKGLIWKDFALYDADDTATEDNLLKAGYVGAFIHNWDYPYRNGDDSINAGLKRSAGEDAGFVAVECFKNDAGIYRKYNLEPVDRKVFFPATNDEPLASMFYLDWISKYENRLFLQIGEEGITHEVLEDGGIKTIAAKGEKIMNSPNNIDYTITINGLSFEDPDVTAKSLAQNYSGIESEIVQKALKISLNELSSGNPSNVFGAVKSQENVGASLTEKRNTILDQAVVASPEKFDEVFDKGMQDYLSSGGQAIIDERSEKWESMLGDKTDFEFE